jgi:hypothetical protein
MLLRRRRYVLRLLLAGAVLGLTAGVVAGAGAYESMPCPEPDPVEALPQTSTEPTPPDVPRSCPEPDPAEPPPGTATGEESVPAETEPAPATTDSEPAPSPPPKASPKPAPAPKPAATPGPSAFAGFRLALPPQSVTPPLAGGPYVFPVLGPVSYSDTWGAARATVAWHHGVDIFAPLGAAVVAVSDGTVFSVGWNAIGGWRLWLRDREGNYFYYAHLSAFSKRAVDGARVVAGTVLGYVGNTGDAAGTPYHLHFEVHPVSLLSLGYDGAVNPTPYVEAWQQLDGGSAIVSLADGIRWGFGQVAAAAPPPGAMLLGYADISSSDAASTEPLAAPAIDPASLAEPEAPAEPDEASLNLSAPAEPSHAQIANRLDAEAGSPAAFTGGVWDRLAVCEAGGDWGANTGNGYFGGLQFHPETWTAYGGVAHAPTADLASREEQMAVAARVLAGQGWNAWPVCSREIGLR